MKSKLYIFLTMLLACTMQVKGGTSTKIVGNYVDGTSDKIGFYTNYKYSADETLYLKGEIGLSGYITKLAYYVQQSNGNFPNSTVKIYMMETDKTTLTNNNKITDVSSMTEVYSSSTFNVGSVAGNWEEITLSTPFFYSGKKNLIVAVTGKKSGYTYIGVRCDKTSNRHIHKCNDVDDSYSLINTTGMVEDDRFPVTRFTFQVESTESVIGQKETTSASNGFGEYYRNYAGQTLYLADEIGQTGQITEIAFQAQNSAGTTIGDLEIYMAETDLTELNDTSKLTKSEMTQVYDGKNITMAQLNGEYVSVVLDTPFKYSGTKNLVVAIRSKKATFKEVKYNCRNISGRCVRISNYTQSGGTVTPFDSNLSSSDYVPVTRFGFNIQSTNCFSSTARFRCEGSETAYNVAYYPNYAYTSTISLYTAKELNIEGEIEWLGFDVAKLPSRGQITEHVKLYLAETDKTQLSTSDKFDETMFTEVFDGDVTLGDKTGYTTLRLSTPFIYSGGRNLLVAVCASSGTNNVYSDIQFNSIKQANRTIYSYSDTDATCYNLNHTKGSMSEYLPSIRFTYKWHGYVNSYTSTGIGICSMCGKVSPYSYQEGAYINSSTRGISNVGNLQYLSRLVARGASSASNTYVLTKDIDMSGVRWTPIGAADANFNSVFKGYYGTAGHTIRGLAEDQYLFNVLGTGTIQSVRLESGKLVKTGTSGKVSSCLTLGSALFGSRTSTVIDSSYYVSNTANTTGGRTSKQMKSGMVTYGLNHAATTGGAKWYQTIGSDNYPVFDSSRGTVYRCTKCEKVIYTNTSSDEGQVYPHNWVNTICKVCNSQPTTFAEDQSLSFSDPYKRTVEARMTNGAKLTYKRSYGLSTLNKWQPLYVPFSFEYQSGWTEYFDIAEIQSYGVVEDTNEDGIVNSQDEKKLIVSYLKPGDKTTANAPYLIMPKSGKVSSITFQSCDGIVYPNTVSRLDLSTMKENVAIVGNYTSSTTSTAFQMDGGVLKQKSASIPYFTWFANPTYKNGKAWDQNEINIFAHHLGSLDLIDGSSTYTIAQELVYDNVSYTRSFDEEMAHNWQAVYLPFDVVVEKKQDSEYPKYATFQKVRTEKGVEVFYLDMHKDGDVIPACTPFLVCFDEPTNLSLKYSMTTVYPCNGGEDLCFSSDQANYTIAGVFAPTKPSASTWYAIARFDGKFHPASSTATLPAFRFYMTIEGANASELRFAFRDAQEIETGIATVASDMDNQDIYSLDGRKVQSETLQSGIYIKNGKKFSVRK